MRRIALLAAALLVVVLLPSAASGASQACEEMRGRLVRGGSGSSGLLVVDVESGKVLCARAAKRVRPLASNMKLFTTATALTQFGPQHRIETSLMTDGEVDEDGTLRGNLYLRGAGDPALGSPAFYNRYSGGLGTNLFSLKAQLRVAGVDTVTGRLYADDTVFDRLRGVADSGYATSSYIGPLSGLAFNSGYGSSNARGFATDPARLAASKLARALSGASIAIPTGVGLRATPPNADPIATVSSPTMSQLVEATNVYSNNFYAEMLIKLIGAELGGAGTTRAGAGVIERFARSHGAGIHAVDGSGLTRTNRGSPLAVVRLLQAMRSGEIGEQFIQDLAITGQEGTVASRMHGSAAYGRCRTKTGTLTGVSNLSGYCFNRSGRVIAFSILMAGVGDLGLAHYEQDRIAALVAGY